MIKQIDNPLEIDWGLKPLQQKLLEILTYFHSFCEEHQIEYCLAYGSALGAKRHQGFIPWDDDVDLYITIEEYRRFRELFALYGNHEHYYLQEVGSFPPYYDRVKVRMNNTSFLEEDYHSSNLHQGIFIDVFLLYQAPKSNLQRRIMLFANQYIRLKKLSNLRAKHRKALRPLLAVMRLFPKDFLMEQALSYLYRWEHKETQSYYDSESWHYKTAFLPKSMLFPSQEIEFGGKKLCGPNQMEAYLQFLYNDYIQLPTVDSIKKNHHSSVWDVEKDFRHYLPHIIDFSDEKG